MTWEDRMLPSIKLTSPSGVEFEALWVGDGRSKEKRLGIFSYPKVPGVIAQDLDIGGVNWPLTIRFAGPDNDQVAEKFWKTWNELGLWQILHPTKGLRILQAVSITEQVRPVESGNITLFETEWLEVAPDITVASVSELAAGVQSTADDAVNEAIQQFEEGVVQESASEVNATVAGVEKGLSAFDEFMADFVATSSEINSEINAIRLGIQNSLSTSPLDLGVLGAQVQSIMNLPANIEADLNRAQQPFRDFADSLSNSLSSDVNPEARNELFVSELFLAGASIAMSRVSVNNEASDRGQALDALAVIGEVFEQITDSLDDAQALYDGELLGDQYFSQSRSFMLTAQTAVAASAFLLRSTYDLAAEKRFTLGEPTAPVKITIDEYGTLGEGDVNFDFVIATNSLHGNDIIMLPAGREVIVYVSP